MLQEPAQTPLTANLGERKHVCRRRYSPRLLRLPLFVGQKQVVVRGLVRSLGVAVFEPDFHQVVEVPLTQYHEVIETGSGGERLYPITDALGSVTGLIGAQGATKGKVVTRFAYDPYFNAAGAALDGSIGEDHTPESHLIPIILQVALGQRERISICGDDYPTPDGTCIRDYVHVEDLATAHLAALERLQPGVAIKVNLGTGQGYSVREVVQACRQTTGHPMACAIGSSFLFLAE